MIGMYLENIISYVGVSAVTSCYRQYCNADGIRTDHVYIEPREERCDRRQSRHNVTLKYILT